MWFLAAVGKVMVSIILFLFLLASVVLMAGGIIATFIEADPFFLLIALGGLILTGIFGVLFNEITFG